MHGRQLYCLWVGPHFSFGEEVVFLWNRLTIIRFLTQSDGGGVRGLSSLYILREIMQAIKEIDESENGRNAETTTALPLPCNYFDFMIGTSTGG